jgi:hypothetical protein
MARVRKSRASTVDDPAPGTLRVMPAGTDTSGANDRF